MIVSVSDLADHLELPVPLESEVEAVLQALLERVEGAFRSACGRTDRPFLEASTGVVETLDGTGMGTVWVSRPVAAVTEVFVDSRVAGVQTYGAAQLYAEPGSRQIRARDTGLVFGGFDEPGAVRVTYDAASDVPEDAQLAVLRASAALYLQRGAEDVRAESEGGVRSEFAPAFEDPTWRLAVDAHREPRLA